MDDTQRLLELNEQFIGGFRAGLREQVEPLLAPDFVYLDGVTAERRDRAGYLGTMTGPSPTLAVDQVVVHVSGDVAVVAGRITRDGTSFRRYVDTWVRRSDDAGWSCVHGCLWPLP